MSYLNLYAESFLHVVENTDHFIRFLEQISHLQGGIKIDIIKKSSLPNLLVMSRSSTV